MTTESAPLIERIVCDSRPHTVDSYALVGLLATELTTIFEQAPPRGLRRTDLDSSGNYGVTFVIRDVAFSAHDWRLEAHGTGYIGSGPTVELNQSWSLFFGAATPMHYQITRDRRLVRLWDDSRCTEYMLADPRDPVASLLSDSAFVPGQAVQLTGEMLFTLERTLEELARTHTVLVLTRPLGSEDPQRVETFAPGTLELMGYDEDGMAGFDGPYEELSLLNIGREVRDGVEDTHDVHVEAARQYSSDGDTVVLADATTPQFVLTSRQHAMEVTLIFI